MPKSKEKSSKKSADNMDTENPPENISLDHLWTLMCSIKEDTKATRERLDKVEHRVMDLEKGKDTVYGTIMSLQSDVDTLKDTVTVLSGRLIRSERKTQRIQNELSDVQAHSMKNNIIFTLDKNSDYAKKQKEQDCTTIVRGFLIEVMKISFADKFYIPVAHRLGQSSERGMSPIIAKFPNAAEMDTIMRHTNRLKGTRHFLTRQLPPEKRERKQFALTEFSSLKKNTDNKIRMTDEKIYVNGLLQRKFLAPSLPEELGWRSVLDIDESDSIEDKGSTFKGYVADVTSLDKIRLVLDSLVRRPDVAAAQHVIYAYRIETATASVSENFDSDGDYGALITERDAEKQYHKQNLCCNSSV
jgi:hypothetical protein